MVVTMEQVIAVLSPEEPDYTTAVKLGSEALPHLNSLVNGEHLGLATKAISLVSLIQNEQSLGILKNAAKSKHDVIRVAVALGAPNLKLKGVDSVLKVLSTDKDESIRRHAVRSLQMIKTDD